MRNCTDANLNYLDAAVNRRVISDTIYVNIDEPIVFVANYESDCAPYFLWEIDDHTKSNELSFTHSFRDPGEYEVKLTALCARGCDELVDRLQVVAIRGRFISNDPARAQIHLTRQKPVVAAAFFVEPASQLDEFNIKPTRDVNIRNERQSSGVKHFDVSKSRCNNEYGFIVAIHKRDPTVRFGATVVDGRIQVMNEGGRTLSKSAYKADQALNALMLRLNVLEGGALGAITAGTLDQLGYEKAFEFGALVSNAASFLPGPPSKHDISCRQNQEAKSWSGRRGAVKEIGPPPQRITPNTAYPREQLILPSRH